MSGSVYYPVAEKFISINGEGTRAGELAVFIRFRGCNLRCSYCDTAWANSDSAPTVMTSARELAGYADRSGIRNVTLTGGEPLLQKDISALVQLLGAGGHSVEIETNGAVSVAKLAAGKYRPVITMDYKLPSSGMEKYMMTGNFSVLCRKDTVKFVTGSTEDLERAAVITEEYSLTERCNVYLSPVYGAIDPADMVEFMKSRAMNGVRLQLQLHKYIWDPGRRGV